MVYATAEALRDALDARLVSRAQDLGIDVQRLRRRAAFERILVRLQHAEPERWVLKGGMALELRFANRARTTRDLDISTCDLQDGAGTLRAHLIDLLATDPEGDRFTFAVGTVAPILAAEAGRAGWRVHVDILLAGRVFAAVRLDVVAWTEELAGTEWLSLPGELAFADIPPVKVQAIDRAQHLAEKLHALTRDYNGRPSSRVRDLVDIVLLLELDPPAIEDVRVAVQRVFTARDTHAPPPDLPDPPDAWRVRYAHEADALDLGARTVGDAMCLARELWQALQVNQETR